MSLWLQVFYIIVLVVVSAASKSNGSVLYSFDSLNFEDFKKITNRSYSHFYDESRGREAFKKNQLFVHDHNSKFRNGEASFRLKTNILADMNTDSYLKKYVRLLRSNRYEAQDLTSEIVGSPLLNNTPEKIDWRENGFITQPDNQKSCGSCYAFSIAESLEGQIFKRTGRILKLSPQQIIDCSVSHGNQGCTGGSLRNTLKYLQDIGGLMLSKDYKYISKVKMKKKTS